MDIGLCSTTEPEASKRDFGRKQIENIINDRPLMALYLSKKGTFDSLAFNSLLVNWMAEVISGGPNESLIVWSEEEPTGNSVVEIIPPFGGSIGYLKVTRREIDREGVSLSFESLWSEVAEQLICARRLTDVDALIGKAKVLRMSKEDFVANYLRIRFRCVTERRLFIEEVLLPWGESADAKIDRKRWFEMDEYKEFRQWRTSDQGTKGTLDGWRLYDERVHPFLKVKR